MPSKYTTTDGRPVPRVSDVLSAHVAKEGLAPWAERLGGLGLSHKVARDFSAGVGTMAHAIIESWLLDRSLVLPDPDRALFGSAFGRGSRSGDYLDAWDDDRYSFALERAFYAADKAIKWCESTGIGPGDRITVERSIVCDQAMLGGTPDLIWDSPEGRILIDWKTGSYIGEPQRIQMGAYAYLCATAGMPVESAIIVRCGADIDTTGINRKKKEPTDTEVMLVTADDLERYKTAFLFLLMGWHALHPPEGA